MNDVETSTINAPASSVELLAKNIASFLMPQVTKQVESVLNAHGLIDTHEQHSRLQSTVRDHPQEMDCITSTVASNITGKSPSPLGSAHTVSSSSVRVEQDFGDYTNLSDNVSQAAKSKIWSNTYIDLAELLPNKKKASYSMTCGLDADGNPGII